VSGNLKFEFFPVNEDVDIFKSPRQCQAQGFKGWKLYYYYSRMGLDVVKQLFP